MTLKDIDRYFKAFKRKTEDENTMQDMKVARILCMLANINRNTKTKPTPYKESDFMPRKERKKQTPEEMANIFKALTIGLGGEIKNG